MEETTSLVQFVMIILKNFAYANVYFDTLRYWNYIDRKCHSQRIGVILFGQSLFKNFFLDI